MASLEAVVAAKIARHDFPAAWPTLVSDLTTLVRIASQPGAPPTTSCRTLTLNLQIVKELSTIRLTRPKASLYSAAPELFHVLRDAYFACTQGWEQHLASNQPASDDVIRSMDTSEAIFKIIRRLIISGYEAPHHEAEIQDFWQQTLGQTQRFVGLLQQNRGNQYFTLIGLHLTQLAKFHVNMANEHPVAFGMLPGTPGLVRMYWMMAKPMRQIRLSVAADDDDDEDGTVYDSLCLRGLLLIRACFKIVYNSAHSIKFKSVKNSDETKLAKANIKDDLLNDEFVAELFIGVLGSFFKWSPADEEEWTLDPEEWELKVDGDEEAHDGSVRPCAERLFLDITLYFKDKVTGPLLNICGSITGTTDVFDKDAIFSAIGLAAPMLEGKFDFNTFLTQTVVPELQKPQDRSNVIRRRVAILLSQWIGVGISDSNRPLVYQIFEHLLDKSIPANDQTVRITAGKRFHDIANEWKFKAEDFAPQATTILDRIVQLISEVQMPETKMALLHTLSTVIERMELQVGPFANQIVTLLPPLWEESGNEHLMKQAIVSVLAKLVGSLKDQSAPLHSLVLPIVHSALEPGSPVQVYLLEDSLDLLAEIVSQTQTPSPELMALAPLVIPILEMETENVEKSLEILQSFMLLSPADMLQDSIRKPFIQACAPLLKVRKSQVIDLTTTNIELLICSAQSLHGEQGIQQVTQDLIESTLLDKAFTSLHGNWAAKQTTGPNRQELSPDWRNETNYFCILARVILGQPESFASAMQLWASSHGEGLDTALSHLLEEWFAHMDSVGDPTKSKLLCLALTSLLALAQPWALIKLQDYMALWAQLVVEYRDTTGDDAADKFSDTLVRDPNDTLPAASNVTAQDVRQQVLAASDPVYTVPIAVFIKEKLLATIGRVGGQQRFQEEWVANVDQDVIKAFGDLGIM